MSSHLSEDWGWYIDIESPEHYYINHPISSPIKRKNRLNPIYEEEEYEDKDDLPTEEYDYYMNNQKDTDDYEYNSNVKCKIHIKYVQKDTYSINKIIKRLLNMIALIIISTFIIIIQYK